MIGVTRRMEATWSFREERLTPLRIADRIPLVLYLSIRRADLKREWRILLPHCPTRILNCSEWPNCGALACQERNPACFSLSSQRRFAAASSRAAADGAVTFRFTKY